MGAIAIAAGFAVTGALLPRYEGSAGRGRCRARSPEEAARRPGRKMVRNRLIFDTDGGVDDAQALLLLIANDRAPDAITTSTVELEPRTTSWVW